MMKGKDLIQMRMKRVGLILAVIPSTIIFGQVTGLEGWDIYLDPGHGQGGNVGVFGYPESLKNLGVAWHIHDLLMSKTDIDTVYLSRTTDNTNPGLYERGNEANQLGVDWLHSIHSDAGSSTANSTLLLYGQYTHEAPYYCGEKVPHGGKAMSEIMVDILTRGMRTTSRGARGDCCDFYGGGTTAASWCTSGNNGFPGPYLAMNRYPSMPSQLSESGFHTNPTQNQRNMGDAWKRMEAYTFYWSILSFHGLDRPEVSILNGIVYDAESGVPVNGAVATAGGVTDTTDTFEEVFHLWSSDPDKLHNGYYFLEDVVGDTVELIVSAPDYYPDTVQVAMVDTFFTFKNRHLVSSVPPTLVASTPMEGDSLFPAWEPIVLEFSRPMDTDSFATTFEKPGGINGTFLWYDDNRELHFHPDSLELLTEYSLTIPGTAVDAYGHPFDANGDGTGGDSLTISFRTGPADLFAPQPIAMLPVPASRDNHLQPIINLEYDEAIDSASVTEGIMTLVNLSNSYSVPGVLEHFIVRERSTLNFFPSEMLDAGKRYSLSVLPGLRDLLGNEETETRAFVFNTGDQYYLPKGIDNFNNGIGNWFAPGGSGSTHGINADTTALYADTTYLNHITNSTRSMRLDYGWDADSAAAPWLIREYLSGTVPRGVHFNNSYTLQTYVFGDGSSNLFRFCVDDGNLSNAATDHEVSPWYTIDWIGWKLVSWDMSLGETGTWADLTDGSLDGTMRFDSFQLSWGEGGAEIGTVYFDDLRIAKSVGLTVAGDIEPLPEQFALYANYPNPFNPSTIIPYDVPREAEVRLVIYNVLGQPVRTLFTGQLLPGHYQAVWDGKDSSGRQAASGIYIYSLQAEGTVVSRKMVLTK